MVVQWARGGRHAGRRSGGRGGRSRVRRVDPDLLGLGGRLGRRGGGRGRVGGLGGCSGLGCQGGLVSEVGAGEKRDGRDDEEGGEARERVHWVGLAAGGEAGREQRLERQADLSSGGSAVPRCFVSVGRLLPCRMRACHLQCASEPSLSALCWRQPSPSR